MPAVATLAGFEAAIEAFDAEARVGWSEGARAAAERSLDRHGLLLLGEVHGVAENPLVIEHLVAELGVDVVALEWPRGLELAVDDPARLAGDDPAARVAWFGDGRVTAGHFAVLRRVPVRVAAINEPVGSADAVVREADMARGVEALLEHGRVLFVAGNLHTQLTSHLHYDPAGMHLAVGRPELCTLDVHYVGGRFWNGGPRRFAREPGPSRPHLRIDGATEATVLTRAH